MTKRLVIFALAVMTFAAAPQALKAADAGGLCPLGNATKHGTYMSRGEGTIVGVGPATAVGWLAYDGKGSVVNGFTVSVNGVISTGVTVTGTYTVNRDCTGSETASDGTHYDFVVAPDGSRFNWIETDTGTVIDGTAIRISHENSNGEASTDLSTYAPAVTTFATAAHGQKAADADAPCPLGNATLRGTSMSRGEGTVVGVGPLAAVGWLAYDGKGNVVNGFTVSVNGVISRGTISGPYTVNSDCTGSTNLSGGHYDFVVTPDGSKVNWIGTDPGGVFSGTEIRLGNSSELKE